MHLSWQWKRWNGASNPIEQRHNSILQDIVEGNFLPSPIAVVVAHPDDETLGMGARLNRIPDLRLIHATDGGSQNPQSLKKAGVSSSQEYSRLRVRELGKALAILGAKPITHHKYDFIDGRLTFSLQDFIARLEHDLKDVTAVITHAYEGGHPDHDACAYAVAKACKAISMRTATPVTRLEFSGYHAREGHFHSGSFWPDGTRPAAIARLTYRERLRKRSAMKSFRSQKWILNAFTTAQEEYRGAPDYDFHSAPPPGSCYYDRHGWALTRQRWLETIRLYENVLEH